MMNNIALTPFATTIGRSIATHAILPPASEQSSALLVALSGGADSVALLRAMVELGYSCEAAHCNFGLRGAESDRDQAFCTELCHTLGIRLHTTRFATHDYAATRGISIEMAARDLRYEYFDRLIAERGLLGVAVAHHRDDNAETILLNMVRGTGIKGLTGMAYRRGNVVRPLLDVGRCDIIAYLASLHQDYITDSSNMVPDVKRNIIRLRLMPILQELNPSVVQTLIHNAQHLDDIYHHALDAGIPQWETLAGSSRSVSKKFITDRFVLYELIAPFGFSASQIDDIWSRLHGPSGALYHSATHQLLRDRDCILVTENTADAPTPPTIVNLTGCDTITIGNLRISLQLADIAAFANADRSPTTACLDADKIGSTIGIRPTQRGDRFQPFGMRGSKLISDYMTDRKFTLFEKRQQLVMTSGDDIIWLVGQRPDDRYRITETTRRILIARILNNSQTNN